MFNIHFSFNEIEPQLRKILRDAEKKGLVEITAEKPFAMSCDNGQILEDRKNKYHDGDIKRCMKVWEVVGFDKRESSVTLRVVEGDYHPKKRFIIPEREMMNEVDKIGHGLIRVGRFIINEKGDYGRILKMCVQEIVDKELSHNNEIRNPHRDDIMMDCIYVEYEFENDYRIDSSSIDKIKFDGKKETTLEKFTGEWNVISEQDIVKHEREMKFIEESGQISQFSDILRIGSGEHDSIAEHETTKALVGLNSKEHLQVIHSNMAVRKNEGNVMMANMKRSIVLKQEEINLIMENKRRELASVMNRLNEAIAVFEKEMTKIFRLITTLEIYMGVHENVIQISEGTPALESEPINLRQMQLYMDEEFGDAKDEGLDFEQIEKFDAWLVDSKGYERVVPEKKCVVVLRPRRNMKKREGYHWQQKAAMEKADRRAYILIRNGHNLYRIWTDNIEVQDRLFPMKSELQQLIDRMGELEEEKMKTKSEYDHKNISEKMFEVESEVFQYKKNMLLLQGIIMRTEIFTPLPLGLNVLDIATHKGAINFIYDEEASLPDGRLRYAEWLTEVNKTIVKGSRIFITQVNVDGGGKNNRDRFSFYSERDNYPSMPNDGVYELKMRMEDRKEDVTEWMHESEWKAIEKSWDKIRNKYKTNNGQYTSWDRIPQSEYKHQKFVKNSNYCRHAKDGEVPGEYVKVTPIVLNENTGKWGEKTREWKEEVFYVSYNPGDTVYGSWGEYDPHERKKGFTYKIYPQEDRFIINYDALLLEDVEFYMENRVDRPNYLKMMPVLKGLKEKLVEERKNEKLFVSALAERLKSELNIENENDVEAIVWKAVNWWKNEIVTVWKRALTKDDAKAWRMITQESKRLFKKELNLDIDTGVNNKNKVLVWKKSGHRIFIGTGFTKGEFLETIIEKVDWGYVQNGKININSYDGNSKAKILREINETTNLEYKKLCDASNGKLLRIDPLADDVKSTMKIMN